MVVRYRPTFNVLICKKDRFWSSRCARCKIERASFVIV
jgi:hypothetical protein